MIDICIPIYKNYDLLNLQIEFWNQIDGEFRLLVCDNTPAEFRKPIKKSTDRMLLFYSQYSGIDGESHGSTLDFLVENSKTDIVGICDSDFFWLKKDILQKVQKAFDKGCKCYGSELWYGDFDAVNERYPERAGWLSPCVFGMFVDRKLAMEETFVVTSEEGSQLMETGWRLRKKIIDEKIPCHVIKAFKENRNTDSVFYESPNNPIAFHWIKGSSWKCNQPLSELKRLEVT